MGMFLVKDGYKVIESDMRNCLVSYLTYFLLKRSKIRIESSVESK